ncbi:Na/Pi cotransporter family protein [Motiliproteus sp. MSK22-1]|uniref:Na/Pi cotransporter family protein n=1 Tax=Motiliproteus sp. MSK22-1 TaxID=1897630 RepID=UPI0009780E46|nr:Na/Pi symporter [Motiliproteus sp. MSK22-1]OMH30311.1 sodium:phosphate symporter [Motiliproteus sp. MSK22-1]
MLRKILLPTIFAILAYGFWLSPNFKEIAAGVAIFLFGMLSLEEGFKVFTGGVLEKLLKRSTDRLWKSLSFGVVTTTLMQSSTLVSVLTISFLSAGILGLSEGIGIIFGANLGTTTGAWLVAGFGLKVNISAYAMPMLVFGIILVFQKQEHLKGVGYVLTGLGFLFLGIHHMKEGFEAFRDNFDLAAYAVSGYAGLLLYAVIGVAATVVMQSSHATLVLIITALSANHITYENALALAIGANIGTTVTALVSALGADISGKRLAGAHLIFNGVTGLIAIVLISELIWAVDVISLSLGIDDLDFTLKLAVFHTLFNLMGILVMLPFIQPMVKFLSVVLKEKPGRVIGPLYIYSATIEFPDAALEAVRKETLHIFDHAQEIIIAGLGMSADQVFSEKPLKKQLQNQNFITRVDIEDLYNRKVKRIFSAVIAFISAADFSWKEKHPSEFHWLREANRNIVDAVKGTKHLQKNMLRYLVSDNHHISVEYNRLRISIAELLFQLHQIRNGNDPDLGILSLDELKLDLKEFDIQQSRRLYQLIHENRITPEMGSSLMNDSAYVASIRGCLISMASTLFVTASHELSSAERQIALDDSEIEDVLEKDS